MPRAMPNFGPVMRGVPRQEGQVRFKMNALRRMAQNTGAGGAVDFVPGSACTPNWSQPPIERNADGCPTSWNGCGDKVFAKWTLPAAAGPAQPSISTQIITAPFQMVAREVICSARYTDPASGDVISIAEGDVLWNQAKTANSGTSIYGADQNGGVDITFFFRNSFFSRLVNVPIYANQPGGERVFVNNLQFDVDIFWTEIGQSAHMLPAYED